MVNHRRLIIPGKVARIRHELTEALPDWEIIVGPGDAKRDTLPTSQTG